MERMFLTLINNTLTVSYLIVAVICARLFLKKSPKWVSCVLWAIVAIRLICPFTIQSALSLIPSAQPLKQHAQNIAYVYVDTGIQTVDTVVNPVLEDQMVAEVETGASVSHVKIMLSLLSYLWAIGACLMIIYALVSYLMLKRRVRAAAFLKDGVYEHSYVKTPFILGIFAPKIYLPKGMSDATKACVLSHERAHIKRFDHVWKPVGFLILAIYWINPLCWIAYVLLCRDIEFACDEMATKNKNEAFRADYCQALLDLSMTRKMITACPVAFGEIGVKDRVKSVLNYKKPAFWIIIVSIVTCSAVGIFFATSPKEDSDKTETAMVSDEKNVEVSEEIANEVQTNVEEKSEVNAESNAEVNSETEAASVDDNADASETTTETASVATASDESIKEVNDWAQTFFSKYSKILFGEDSDDNIKTDYKIVELGEDTTKIAFCAIGEDKAENVVLGEMKIKKATDEPGSNVVDVLVKPDQDEEVIHEHIIFVEPDAGEDGESEDQEIHLIKIAEDSNTFAVDSTVYYEDDENGHKHVGYVTTSDEIGSYYITSLESSSTQCFSDAEFFTKENIARINQAYANASSNGMGEKLNQNAQNDEKLYDVLSDAKTAAKAFMNGKQDGSIVQEISIEETDKGSIAKLAMKKGAMNYTLKMQKPWGEEGIWIPLEIGAYEEF